MICDKYDSKKCPARLHYEVDENNKNKNFIFIKNHNHEKPEVDFLIRQFKTEFKKEIMTTLTKPCIIYTNLCLRFPDGAALVPFASMISTINNWRREIRPKHPKSLEEYVLQLQSDQWKNYLTRNKTKLQIKHIRSSDKSSAVVLADENFLRTINTTHLLVDATYEVCPLAPREIYQFLTIMAVIENNAFPITWALMTNKTKISYTDIFNYFKTIAPHLRINSIMSDFELGLMSAVKSCYIHAQPEGCNFHFVQAVLRKTTKLKVDILIEDRDDMKVFIRKLLGLALLPADDIKEAFMWLVNNNKEISQLLKKLTDYFVDYWLKIVKPERFSCFRNRTKTNNFIESYHRTLKLKLGSHPPIWEFTEGIAALQELSKIEKTSLEQNLNIRKFQNRKITQKNDMIDYLWDLYENGTLDIPNFLQCASHVSKAFNNKLVWTSTDDVNNFIMPTV
ncbi:uncharacterized protein LOC123268107 [Cotesia glomerata]|uniref:uncharacterized protein LOC123268107 n=1 Tax=Cotesia glomerata TaxID=32391 RepID=UPI001D024125|nr:uncharacterized protein LOC123268107 [Cotesia glomerata]